MTKKTPPFSGLYTSHLPARNNKHRLKRFRKFFGWDTVPEGLRVLDTGHRNYIGVELGITDFTRGDLNVEMGTHLDEYDVILSMEVINHLYNHQTYLENINRKLKMGGTLYLSTPRPWLIFLPHGKGNYVEMSPRSIRIICEHFGFKPKRYECRNPWFWWFPLYGIRPIFKFIFNRYQLWEFEKVENV